MHLDDAGFIFQLLNSPGWIQFIGDRKIHDLEAARKYLSSRIIPAYEKFGYGFYIVETRDPRNIVGTCGLLHREGLSAPDIGFAMLPEYMGLGYAFEAACAVMEYGYQVHQIPEISAITTTDNVSSQKLLKKLGMSFQTMIKLPDDPESLMLFSKLAGE